jgi:hypothetical protein
MPSKDGVLIAVLVPAAVFVMLHASPAAAVPQRVRVALFGDSIVEGDGAPRGDLATWVRWELGRLHAAVGARGYVAAHQESATAGPGGTLSSFPWTYSAGWSLDGLQGFSPPSNFGANGRMSATTSPSATATTRLAGNRFAVLFARSPDSGRFSFSVDDRSVDVDARRRGTDGRGIRWVRAPRPGRVHRITVHGPASGTLRFTGLIARREVGRSRQQIEVSGVGQVCGCAIDPLPATRAQAFETLHAKVTLLMFGTNAETYYTTFGKDPAIRQDIEAGFVRGIERRGRLARRGGGECVVVPHAPNTRPAALQRLFSHLALQGAKAAHCRFAPVLQGLWPGRRSQALGLTRDGIHPTAAGYRRMSARLARLILAFAR